MKVESSPSRELQPMAAAKHACWVDSWSSPPLVCLWAGLRAHGLQRPVACQPVGCTGWDGLGTGVGSHPQCELSIGQLNANPLSPCHSPHHGHGHATWLHGYMLYMLRVHAAHSIMLLLVASPHTSVQGSSRGEWNTRRQVCLYVTEPQHHHSIALPSARRRHPIMACPYQILDPAPCQLEPHPPRPLPRPNPTAGCLPSLHSLAVSRPSTSISIDLSLVNPFLPTSCQQQQQQLLREPLGSSALQTDRTDTGTRIHCKADHDPS